MDMDMDVERERESEREERGWKGRKKGRNAGNGKKTITA